MAGTLVLDTLQNGAGTASTSADNVIRGSAKAWVNFNGTGTVAIRASYNVSSITDDGTGAYTVNFTNAFADTNYAAVGFCRKDNNSIDGSQNLGAGSAYGKNTGNMSFQCFFANRNTDGAFDSPEVDIAFFR